MGFDFFIICYSIIYYNVFIIFFILFYINIFIQIIFGESIKKNTKVAIKIKTHLLSIKICIR